MKRLLAEQHETLDMPNYEALARDIVKAALRGRALERNALLVREWPAVEHHHVEVADVDDQGLRSRLASLTPRAETNGLDHHTNGAAEEEPS